MGSYEGDRYGHKLRAFGAERDEARQEAARLREQLAIMTDRCALLSNAVEALAALIGQPPAQRRSSWREISEGEAACPQWPDGRCTPAVPCSVCPRSLPGVACSAAQRETRLRLAQIHVLEAGHSA